jgi:hypothetical protein
MRGFALVLLLGLSACNVHGQDVDAGQCIDCDWRPPDARWLALFPALPGGQQNCDTTAQRAAWIRVQETPERLGKIACVPDGSVGLGGACSFGPVGETTGFDNCAGGFICSEGICADICALDAQPGTPHGCANGTCTVDPDLFAYAPDDPGYGACR